jgi:hypothetical protein
MLLPRFFQSFACATRAKARLKSEKVTTPNDLPTPSQKESIQPPDKAQINNTTGCLGWILFVGGLQVRRFSRFSNKSIVILVPKTALCTAAMATRCVRP